MNNVLEHFFGVHYPTLPEIICAGRQPLLAPVIDAAVLISLEPRMLLVHLSEFSKAVSSGSHPYICVMEITKGLFDRKRDRGLAFIVIERIVRSCVLEEVGQIVLATRDLPCATKIVSTHNFRGLEIGD